MRQGGLLVGREVGTTMASRCPRRLELLPTVAVSQRRMPNRSQMGIRFLDGGALDESMGHVIPTRKVTIRFEVPLAESAG